MRASVRTAAGLAETAAPYTATVARPERLRSAGSADAPPEETGELARRILSNAAYRSFADVASKLISIVFYIVLARKLGSTAFGVFTFGYSLAALLTTFGGFGQANLLTREVARRRDRLPFFFSNTLALNVVLSVPPLVIALVAMAALGRRTETVVLVLLGSALIVERLMNTCFAVFQAFERLVFVPVVLIAQRLVTAAVGVAALLAGADVVTVCGIYLGGAIVALAIAGFVQFRFVTRPTLAIDPAKWTSLLRMTLPMGLFTAFSVALSRADTIMLAAFKPHSVVGHYGAAYRLFESTLFISWGVTAGAYPVLARLTPMTTPSIGAIWQRSLKLVVALTLPIATGAAILAQPVITTLYGNEYQAGATALALLAPMIALYPVAFLCGAVIISSNQEWVLPKMYAAVAAENILANLVLIPWLSLRGAALGTSISQVILTAWLVVHARRSIEEKLDWRRLLIGPVGASAAAGAVMAAAHSMLVLAIPAAAIVFVAVLVAVERATYPQDARVLIDFVARRLGRHASDAAPESDAP
jgi:O-antigen/teichoic acid export membrane protein